METKVHKTPFYLMPGFYMALGITIVLFAVSWITQYQKELFVTETGNLKIVGMITVTISLLMVFKIKVARVILIPLVAIPMLSVFVFTIIIDAEYRLALAFLTGVLILVFYLLVFSKHLKAYFNK